MTGERFEVGDHARIHRPPSVMTGGRGPGLAHGKEGVVRWVERDEGFPDWLGLVDEQGGLWPISAASVRRIG